MTETAIPLRQLANRVTRLLSAPEVRNVWVTAETSDVSVNRGHCYLDLVEKDDGGVILAKCRATIWSSMFAHLSAQFRAAAGRPFGSGLKVMVLGTVNYHPAYGLSINITAINPEYTLGDIARRRMEILRRLEQEGILNSNRELPWPAAPQRVAIISARGAAGYGDFINQLFTNPRRLRFTALLFTALLQGPQAPASVIEQLHAIGETAYDWDCVVIIRGGGASSDLESFDSYELAREIALFPLPVVVGIGHERDVTALDYVATRVKTPTAAAELLIRRCGDTLDAFESRAQAIHRLAAKALADERERLSYAEAMLPIAPLSAVERAKALLSKYTLSLSGISTGRIAPAKTRLDIIAASFAPAVANVIARRRDGLNAAEKLLDALSPIATLKRGYSITRVDGHAVTDPSAIPPGAEITTILAGGELKSIAK